MPSTRTICTLQYNPYSNREKKGYTLYTGYAPYVVGTFTGINFNPADGVNTELILNTVSDKADYCLVMDGTTIESRWFILDCNRTRGGQYQLQLYRDVVYDNLPEVMSATAFIEKGWINERNNPLIFNEEAITTNQRKMDERLIRDKTRTPWIVGYIPKKTTLPDGETFDINVVKNPTEPIPITSAQYNILNSGVAYDKETVSFLMGVGKAYTAETFISYRLYYDSSFSNEVLDAGAYDPDSIKMYPNLRLEISNDAIAQYISGIGNLTFKFYEDSIRSTAKDNIPGGNITAVKDLNGLYVSYDNKVYKVTINEKKLDTTVRTFGSSNVSGFNDKLTLLLCVGRLANFIHIYNVEQQFRFQCYQYTINFEEVSLLVNYHLTIPADNIRLHLDTEANYTMFCMPWNNFKYHNSDSSYTELRGETSRLVAQAISTKFSGSGILLDLQLVPYCPIQNALSNSGLSVESSKLIVHLATPIYEGLTGTTVASYLFWCTTAKIDITRTYSFTMNGRPDNIKVEAQTLTHRISAPDKSSIYEYSPYKIKTLPSNLDSLQDFDYRILCTYKPYKPFIYVEVQSDGDSLYGTSFTDGRGLICSGDFSLPQTSDAWETYLILNKNYSNIFNRQVQSIELQNRYAKMSDIVGAVTGTISGATSGATSGGAIGGVPGAIGGGIASGIASAVGGIFDIGINETLRKDQLDLKKDLYQYNLENIQALPNTLLNVGALTDVNKLYPYIEVFDCTEVEKQALRNKIKYNGMSIGVISEGLSNYLIDDTSERSFIKGQIIKIDLHDDYHMLKNIRQEFETGFFINRGGN